MKMENSEKTTTMFQRMAATLILAAAIGAVYFRTLDNPFIWDDQYLIRNNYFIQNWSNLKLLFSRLYFTQPIELSYRPVTTFTYFVNYALWGLQPAGWHFFNLAIHFLNALVFFAIAARLTRRPWLSLGLSLIFALHPLQTEAINVATFNDDLLCLLFSMLAFLMYMGYSAKPRFGVPRLVSSLILLTLSLFSKETSVVFPALILAYEYFVPEKTSHRKAWGMATLFCIPVIFYIGIRFGPMRGPAEAVIYHGNSFWTTMLLMLHAWAVYISKLFWPARQCADYIFPETAGLFGPAALSAFFVLIAILGVVIVVSLRWKTAAFGAAWFVLMMLPVSNIIPIGVIMAERYLYMAVPGILILAGIALKGIFLGDKNTYPSLSRIFLILCLIAAVISCGAAAARRNRIWDTEISFWKSTCECAPNSARAFVNLGVAYLDNDNLEDAEPALVRAYRLASEGSLSDVRYGTLYRALSNLGIVYARQSHFRKAIGLFRAATEINPRSPYAFWNLGTAYFKTGRFEQAEKSFLNGLDLEPRNTVARMYLISIYHHTGKLEKALEQCDRIIELTPNNSTIRKQKERLLQERGR